MSGKLFIVATPIGNLNDITLRALDTLKQVDIIAAEDTRHSLKLLNHYNISKKMIAYHKHNKEIGGKKVVELLLSGNDVALITDAGTPCISDPGVDLVKLAGEHGIKSITIPGACAAISALSISGLDSSKFVFEGFLPKKPKDIKNQLDLLSHEKRTIILYETPHRIKDTLKLFPQYFQNRNICIATELTKINEAIEVFSVNDIEKRIENLDARGEYVLIIESQSADESNWENISIEQHIKSYMESGNSKMDAVKLVAKDRKISKSEIYKHSLDL